MLSTLLPTYTEMLCDAIANSSHGPISSITIESAGSGYSNTDHLIFTRNASDPILQGDANVVVETDSSGLITGFSIINGGEYSYSPVVSVNTSTGAGANLAAIVDCDNYYLTLGGTIPFNSEPSPDPIPTSYYGTQDFPNQQIIFGVRLTSNSFAKMAVMRPWVANTVFAEYDDMDVNLSNSSFYCVNSSNDVFKCIRNGANAVSTIMPSNTTPTSFPEILADGYQWFYLYSVDQQPPFTTLLNDPNWIPVVTNASVSANSLFGSVLNVVITSAGTGYPSSNGTISAAVIGNDKAFVLSGTPSAIPNYFAGCTLTSWSGSTPYNFVINTSTTSSNGSLQVQLTESPNANQVSAGFPYQIAPSVQLTGDGSGFVAHSVVGGPNQSIVDIMVTNPGLNYTTATANLVNAPGFGSGATIRAIISPGQGHGTNVPAELFANSIGIAAVLANNIVDMQTTYIDAPIEFRTVGILHNPNKFSNLTFSQQTLYNAPTFNQRVALELSGSGAYLPGESITDPSTGTNMWVASVNASSIKAEVVGLKSIPVIGSILKGNQSGTSLTLNNVGSGGESQPDLQFQTGEFVYLNNVSTITISNTSISPIVRIILK